MLENLFLDAMMKRENFVHTVEKNKLSRVMIMEDLSFPYDPKKLVAKAFLVIIKSHTFIP